MFKQKRLKNQEKLKRIKSRPLESFDWYNNKLTYIYDDKDSEHLWWLKNRYYKFCLYSYSDEPKIIYLSNVYVNKLFRKHRYGNILLKHAKHLAKERGYEFMYLKVKSDTWIQKWYERNGFKFHKKVKTNTKQKWVWLKYEIK